MKRLFPVILIAMGLIAISGMLYPEAGVAWSQDGHQQERHYGNIEGRVFDGEGKPAFKFTVYADRDKTERGRIYSARTDKDGFFLLEGVMTGTYTIYAGKESAGYPQSASAIYLDAVRSIKAEVNERQTTPQFVVLTLGPKLGRLSGRIEDTSTKRPVTDVNLTVHIVDMPTYYFAPSVDRKGRFKFIVPPAPFTIDVSAPGYEDWHSSGKDPDRQTEPLQVASGDTRELIVSLRPVKQP